MVEKKKFADLKVGDIIWVTKSRWRSSDEESIEEAVVTKVGRKYISIRSTGQYKSELGQFEIEDGIEKSDYGNKRHLVRSPEAYYTEKTRRKVFDEFRRHFSGYSARLHDDVKTEDIIMAAKLLKIELDL
jgi:hypothetical protein